LERKSAPPAPIFREFKLKSDQRGEEYKKKREAEEEKSSK
jgi:hypothetical protein